MPNKFTFLWITIPLLMACQSHPPIPVMIERNQFLDQYVGENLSFNDSIVRLTPNLLLEKSETNVPYLVYAGNASCTQCLNFQPTLVNWIQSFKPLVYYFDTLQLLHQIESIKQNHPTYFSEPIMTPTLYVFQGNNRLHRIVSRNEFYQSAAFMTFIEQYIAIDDGTQLTT